MIAPETPWPDEALRLQLRMAFARWMVLTVMSAKQEGVSGGALQSDLNWLLERSDLLCRRSSAAHLRKILRDFCLAEEWVHRSLRSSLLQPLRADHVKAPPRCQCGAVLLHSGGRRQCAAFCATPTKPSVNHFKRAIRAGRVQLGVWATLPSPHVSDRVIDSRFDWVLLDTEHCPTDVPDMLQQLQSAAATRPPQSRGCSQAVVRLAWNDPAQIQHWIGNGAQTLLLPFVQNADAARAAVQAVRAAVWHAPGMGAAARGTSQGNGARGQPRGPHASGRTAASGVHEPFPADVADAICVLVQVETPEALHHLEAIASVDGVDGVFLGPADLTASLGHPYASARPDMEAALERALATIRACGKAPGMLAVQPARAQACLDAGALFVAMGMDTLLLGQCDGLMERLQRQGSPAVSASMY